MSSIYDWSLLAASNANADTDVNWAEGQAPSTVNNSARFMMQRIRELLSDLGGIVGAGGSANVLTVTSESAVSSYIDGIRVAFRGTIDNTGAATLNVNAVGAKPVIKFTWEGEKTLVGGEIQAGCIYEVIYSSALNGASGAWLLLNPTPFQETQQIAAGLMLPSASSTVPSGWLECNGSAISRTTYAALFAAIGTSWGAGDGSTTFNIPDTRGEFVRGWDHGKGTDTGRSFASSQLDAIQNITGGFSSRRTTAVAPEDLADWSGAFYDNGLGGSDLGLDVGGAILRRLTGFDASRVVRTATETRARNIAAMYVIKT